MIEIAEVLAAFTQRSATIRRIMLHSHFLITFAVIPSRRREDTSTFKHIGH